MKKLMVRLRGYRTEIRNVLEESQFPNYDFFPTPDLNRAVQYAPLDTEIEKDAWQFVELDAEQVESMIDPYTSVKDENGIPEMDQAEYAQVQTVYMVNGAKIVFCRVGKSEIIGENGKTLLTFTEDGAILKQSSFALDFSGVADAVYDGESKRLYFKNIARVKPLFKGIDIFHQEATRDEKQAFLSNGFFAVGAINPDYISLKDAQRIAAILENNQIDLEDDETQQKIRSYINKYPSSGAGVDDEGKLIINSKDDLRATLKVLDQKFFTSELTDEKYEASNIKRMKR